MKFLSAIKNAAITAHAVTRTNLRKYAPEIWIAVGVGTAIAEVVYMRRQALKEQETMASAKAKVDDIRLRIPVDEETKKPQYTPELRKELRKAIIEETIGYVKLYAGPVIVGGISIASFLNGYRIKKDRYNALAAAYVAMDQSYKLYRERTEKFLGSDLEKSMLTGTQTETLEHIDVDKDGNEVTTTTTLTPDNLGVANPYARFFDSSCKGWTNSGRDHCVTFLRKQEMFAQQIHRMNGELTLNQVYGLLELPKSAAGFHVGWKPNGNGVSFGINWNGPEVAAFLRGETDSLLLLFNPDGPLDADYPKF